MGRKNTTQDNFPANANYLVFGFSLLTLQGWFLVEVGPDWKAPRARLPGIPTGLYQTGPPQLKLSQSQFASGMIQFYGLTPTMGWWAASLSAQLLIAEEIGRGTASAVPIGLENKERGLMMMMMMKLTWQELDEEL